MSAEATWNQPFRPCDRELLDSLLEPSFALSDDFCKSVYPEVDPDAPLVPGEPWQERPRAPLPEAVAAAAAPRRRPPPPAVMSGYPLETVVDVFCKALQISTLNVDGMVPESVFGRLVATLAVLSLLPPRRFPLHRLCLLRPHLRIPAATPLPPLLPRWPPWPGRQGGSKLLSPLPRWMTCWSCPTRPCAMRCPFLRVRRRTRWTSRPYLGHLRSCWTLHRMQSFLWLLIWTLRHRTVLLLSPPKTAKFGVSFLVGFCALFCASVFGRCWRYLRFGFWFWAFA